VSRSRSRPPVEALKQLTRLRQGGSGYRQDRGDRCQLLVHLLEATFSLRSSGRGADVLRAGFLGMTLGLSGTPPTISCNAHLGLVIIQPDACQYGLDYG